MSSRVQFDRDIGGELLDEELFYCLPRSTRKAITAALPNFALGEHVGFVEDKLRDAGAAALALRVLKTAQARRLRREAELDIGRAAVGAQLELDGPVETSADAETAETLQEIARTRRVLS